MHAKLRRAASLPAAQRRAVLRAALWLLLVRVLLRWLSLPRLQARLARGLAPPSRGYDPAALAPIAEAVDIAARNLLPPATCLPRALVLWRQARAVGFPAELRIGVARPEGALRAHAWLEVEGRVVGDRADVARVYAPLERPGAPLLRSLT